jgi:hypothetical protein
MTYKTKKNERRNSWLSCIHIRHAKAFPLRMGSATCWSKSSLLVLACFLGWFQCTPPSCTCKIKEKVTMPCHVAQNTQSPNHFCVYTKKHPSHFILFVKTESNNKRDACCTAWSIISLRTSLINYPDGITHFM